jgi:uncharacterized protein (TIGR03067 family)
MNRLTAVGLLFVVACAASAREEPKKATPPEALKGEWKINSYEHTGAKLEIDPVKSRAAFEGDKFTLRLSIGGEEKTAVSTFTADEKADPKALDVSPPDRKFVAKAIWKIEKDTLTICFAVGGDERPKDFKPSKETSVLVLERVKK